MREREREIVWVQIYFVSIEDMAGSILGGIFNGIFAVELEYASY